MQKIGLFKTAVHTKWRHLERARNKCCAVDHIEYMDVHDYMFKECKIYYERFLNILTYHNIYFIYNLSVTF